MEARKKTQKTSAPNWRKTPAFVTNANKRKINELHPFTHPLLPAAQLNPGRNYIHPPPPPPISGPKAFFREGVGVYILRPQAVGILYAPPFYTPPTPRRVFSGVGGWGCIKFGPVLKFPEFFRPSFCGSENPAKTPAKVPLRFPCKKSKKNLLFLLLGTSLLF